jgi:hypothetical protein
MKHAVRLSDTNVAYKLSFLAHVEKSNSGRSGKLLLALASTVNRAFGPRRDPWPYFRFFQDFYVFWYGTSTSRKRGIWLLRPLCWGWLEQALTHWLSLSLSSIPPPQDSQYWFTEKKQRCVVLLFALSCIGIHNNETNDSTGKVSV